MKISWVRPESAGRYHLYARRCSRNHAELSRSCRNLRGGRVVPFSYSERCRLVITRPPAYVRNMSPAEIEEAVKGLKREELAKLASYIPALRATRADPILALAHNA